MFGKGKAIRRSIRLTAGLKGWVILMVSLWFLAIEWGHLLEKANIRKPPRRGERECSSITFHFGSKISSRMASQFVGETYVEVWCVSRKTVQHILGDVKKKQRKKNDFQAQKRWLVCFVTLEFIWKLEWIRLPNTHKIRVWLAIVVGTTSKNKWNFWRHKNSQ